MFIYTYKKKQILYIQALSTMINVLVLLVFYLQLHFVQNNLQLFKTLDFVK